MNLEQPKKPEYIALEKVITLGKKLKELGLTPCERFFNIETLKNPTAIAGIPIVEDGQNGIRISYENGELDLWFTNAFEDPKNEIRIKVQEVWDNL